MLLRCRRFKHDRYGAELRVAFRHRQETRQGAAHTALRLLEGGDGGGIGEVLDADLHLADLGPRLRDRLEGLALVGGVSLHRLHEVRDEVGAALIGRLHVAPRAIHRLVVGDHGVVPAARGEGGKQKDYGQGSSYEKSRTSHNVSWLLSLQVAKLPPCMMHRW